MHGIRHLSKGTLIIVFLVLFILAPLCYSLYTAHVWEDFFITFKFSKNFCEGNGLVYVPGERVHGFTSPLGVILPAFCYLVTGSETVENAIWLFRLLFCIPAFVGAGIFLISMLFDEDSDHKMMPVVFAGLLFISEAKSVMFSVNGMETAFMLFFLAWAFYLMSRTTFDWLQIGVAWGGLMWTRPDSCVYVAVLSIAFLSCRKLPVRSLLIPMTKAAAVTTIIYLPWFIWAWSYYGSPVPQTVLAKNAMSGAFDPAALLIQIITHVFKASSWVYAPVYPQFPGWNPLVYVFSGGAGAFAALYWVFPWAKNDRLGRMASICFLCLTVYFSAMSFPYPWYFPPAAMLGIIVFVRGIFTLSDHFSKPENKLAVPVIALSGIFLVMMTTLLLSSYEMKLQQKYVEDGTRRKVGEWLNKNTRRSDRIYLEALGYIGYFSDRKILDFPGLVSPEVVELVKKEKLNFVTLVEKLRPEWIVVREIDYINLATKSQYFNLNYELVTVFDSYEKLDNLGYIPGEWYLIYDAFYYVVRRLDVPVPKDAKIELPFLQGEKNDLSVRKLK